MAIVWIALGGLALVALIAPGLKNQLTVRRCAVHSGKLERSVRIAQISDLHACRYGRDQRQLIEAVRREGPDIVAMTGDIFDQNMPEEQVEPLLAGLEGLCPVYYVTGNHEYWCSSYERQADMLRRHCVRALHGAWESVKLKGQEIHICGVDDPNADMRLRGDPWDNLERLKGQIEGLRDAVDGTHAAILLSHRPERFDMYARLGVDLALCGHAHGGQWRVPGLINGLFAPNQGIFPRLAGGVYHKGNTSMVVSRGLSRENMRIPRAYNPPELVVVDFD